MYLSHVIELRPNPAQKMHLDKALGSRRHAYNHLLAHFVRNRLPWSRKEADQLYKRMRQEFPWYAEVSQRVTRQAVHDLDKAFRAFFRRVKRRNPKPGYPRFKKRGRGDTFEFADSAKFRVEGRRLKIERLPTWIKMRQKLWIQGDVRRLTVKKRAGKYFAHIMVAVDETDHRVNHQKESVGVDLGVRRLATCSGGEIFPACQQLKSSLDLLARRQRVLKRKQKGSHRYAKAKQAVDRLHLKVSEQRAAKLHELSHYLTKTYHFVTLEDLDVKDMVKTGTLARAVMDSGFFKLRQQVEYKARLRGGEVIIADRYFPSSKTCSTCGQHNDIGLENFQWKCSHCGATHDRDLNASINLDQYGRDQLQLDLKTYAGAA